MSTVQINIFWLLLFKLDFRVQVSAMPSYLHWIMTSHQEGKATWKLRWTEKVCVLLVIIHWKPNYYILRISLHRRALRLIQPLSSDILLVTSFSVTPNWPLKLSHLKHQNVANKNTVNVAALDIVAAGGLPWLPLVCENWIWVSPNFNVKQCTVREWKWSHPLATHSVPTWRPKKKL